MKHTPAPWTVVEPDEWPFRLIICDANGDNVISVDRLANSTAQNTVADCMNAVGFKPEEKQEIREALKNQRDNIQKMAAASELLEALEVVMDWYDNNGHIVEFPEELARAAIARSVSE